jgi:3,4-dihydroxy 2-butanone 4-phosphate synthase/GTP cyclohydrolase II
VNHFAFVHGELGDGRDVLTRLHRAHILQDVFGGGKAINGSLARFKEAGRGVLIYLRDGTSGVPVAKLPDGERSSSEAERTRQWREIGVGAQILRDLGVSSIRLLSSHEMTYVGLSGFGIEIVKTEAVDG